MNQNPYLKDWLRSIESMNEEELIKAIEDDSRSEEFTKLARDRLAFLRSDNAPQKVWEEKAESAERSIRKKEHNNEIKKEVDNSAENTLSFFDARMRNMGTMRTMGVMGAMANTTRFVRQLSTFNSPMKHV